MAFAQLEPFGGRREDLRAAIGVVASFANNPNRKRYSRTIKPADVFPDTLGEDGEARPGKRAADVMQTTDKLREKFLRLIGQAKRLGG